MAFMGGSNPNQQPNESPRASSANPERWVDEHGDYLYRYALVQVRVPSLLVGILKNKIVDYCRKLGRVVDASVFPSSGAVNPALTVIANALRVGDHLLDRLN